DREEPPRAPGPGQGREVDAWRGRQALQVDDPGEGPAGPPRPRGEGPRPAAARGPAVADPAPAGPAPAVTARPHPLPPLRCGEGAGGGVWEPLLSATTALGRAPSRLPASPSTSPA